MTDLLSGCSIICVFSVNAISGFLPIQNFWPSMICLAEAVLCHKFWGRHFRFFFCQSNTLWMVIQHRVGTETWKFCDTDWCSAIHVLLPSSTESRVDASVTSQFTDLSTHGVDDSFTSLFAEYLQQIGIR